jgi:hypothetical protein
MERCRRLIDLLAVAAGELLPDRLDHLPLPGDHLQRLGDVLAHLDDARGAAAGAGRRRLDHHPLARQMRGKRLASRTAALEGGHGGGAGRGPFGGDLVLGGGGFKLFELEFHLLDQPGAAFGAVAVLIAPQPGDLQLEMRDHRLGGRQDRPSRRQFGFGHRGTSLRGRKFGTQTGNLGVRIGHG